MSMRQQTSRWSCKRCTFLLVAISLSVHAYQPSVGGLRKKSFPSPFGVPIGPDLSSGLISQLAVVALKIRLAGHTDVSCDVNAKPSELLLNGRVGPVTVKGKGWKSSKGLTCRAIEATVDKCELDVSRILSHQKLVLTNPVKGKAMIALNSVDFGNFISHPLMKPPALAGDSPVAFCKSSETKIDAANGSVIFYVDCAGRTWECTLERGADERQRARISAVLEGEEDADSAEVGNKLMLALTKFFNEMEFELDGTFLSFRDMMVTNKGESPSIMLALNINVHKFPSRGVEF